MEKWRGGVVQGLLCLALFTPLIVTHSTLFPFQVGKGIALRILIELAGFFYLWLVLIEPRARPVLNRLFWSVLVYAGVLVLSMLTGVDPYRSFWGDLERMEGVFGVLHAVLAFVIAAGMFKTRQQWIAIFRVSCAASLFVLWYALAQMYPWARFLPVGQPVEVQPGSTLGYASFAATYALFQIFFASFLIVLERSFRWRSFAVAALLVNLLLLSLTAIRGAQVALFFAVIVGAVLFMLDAGRVKRHRVIVAVLLVLSVGGFVGVKLLEGSSFLASMPRVVQRMSTISTNATTAQTRLIALGVSWQASQERPLLGWGPENFGAAYSRHFDPAILSLEDAWFDRPHNKLAEVTVGSGFPGLLSYLAMFILAAFGVMVYLKRASSTADRTLATLVVMLGCAYFVQNLFLFDTAVSTLFFFLMLAFAGTVVGGDPAPASRSGRSRIWILVGSSCVAVWMVWMNVGAFRAAQEGLEGIQAADPGKSLGHFQRSMVQGSFASHEVVRTVLTSLIDLGRVGRPEWEPVVSAVQAEGERLTAVDKADHRMLELQGKVYNRRGAEYSSDAERVLRRAIVAAPRMNEARFELGLTLLRRGDVEGGLGQYRDVVALNERYAKGHWILGVALRTVNLEEEGRRELRKAVELGYQGDSRVFR